MILPEVRKLTILGACSYLPIFDCLDENMSGMLYSAVHTGGEGSTRRDPRTPVSYPQPHAIQAPAHDPGISAPEGIFRQLGGEVSARPFE